MVNKSSAAITRKIAITLAVIAGLLQLVSVVLAFRKTGVLQYGKIASAIAIPALIYAILSAQKPK